jgi:hypothetical protein
MGMADQQAIDKLKAQREKIDARIQALQVRVKTVERKRELQRKILVGTYYLQEALQQDEMEALKQKMNSFLTRDSDRALFDLMPIEKRD